MMKGVNPEFQNFFNSEVPIQSTDYSNESIYDSDEFRMYVFKIKRCTKTRSHDWTTCPFAHRGEKARRRDPRIFNYAPIACPEFRIGECPKGESCEFAHGIFEFWLHPSKYRTRECNAGKYCRRKVCFFAHKPEQLRPVTKHKCRNVCRSTRIGGGKDVSGGSVGGDGRTGSGSSSPTANVVMRNEILKEEWDVCENFKRLTMEDEEDDGGERSFGFWDVPDWITELVD